MLNYTVSKIPGPSQTFVDENGPCSVMAALTLAQIDPAGYEIRLNGVLVTNAADTMVEEGGTITLTKKIKGE